MADDIRRRRDHRRLGGLGRAHGGEARRRRGSRSRSSRPAPRSTGQRGGRRRYWNAVDQGAGVPLSAGAAGHAPDLERPRFLVPAGRAGQVREHLYQGGRRHDLALARHLPPARSQRLPAEVALRPGRRLADLLRRHRAILRRGGERDRGVGRLGGRPRRAADQALSDGGDPADLSRQGLPRRRSPERSTRCGRRRRDGTPSTRDRPAGMLRQCELHSGLPDPGEIRRDRACRPGGRRGRDASRADHRSVRRGRRGPEGRGRSASSAGTGARAGRRERSSSSPRTRSRRRGFFSTRKARRRRTARPTHPIRSAAT